MKKIQLFMLYALCFMLLSACGVKSDLNHPNGDKFPRNYPVS